ncbi:PREDICTED: uncharacterized protein LOC101312594 [Fragaria vesca subsp. vesca]
MFVLRVVTCAARLVWLCSLFAGFLLQIPEYDVRGGLYQCDAANLFSETCLDTDYRIIPRFSVVRVLMLKGLIKEERLSFTTVFATPEKYFLNSSFQISGHSTPTFDKYQGKAHICTSAQFVRLIVPIPEAPPFDAWTLE